jgi:hypothetical protein
MKKIITTLSAGVLAVAFSSASFSGHHESGEGMDMGGMPMPPGVPSMSDAPLMGMDGMPMPPGAPPMGMDGMPMWPDGPPMSEGARAITEASHYAKKFLKDVSQPPEAQESGMGMDGMPMPPGAPPMGMDGMPMWPDGLPMPMPMDGLGTGDMDEK